MAVNASVTNQTLVQIPVDLMDEQALRTVLGAIINRLDHIGYYIEEDETARLAYQTIRPPSIVGTTRRKETLLASLEARLTALEGA